MFGVSSDPRENAADDRIIADRLSDEVEGLRAQLKRRDKEILELQEKFARHVKAVLFLIDEMEQFQIGHAHDETNDDYRPLSDTRGWCSGCTAKVGLNEDFARDAIKKAVGILNGVAE